jgi:hypothetical protein
LDFADSSTHKWGGGGKGAELHTYLVRNYMKENLTYASTSVHDFFLILISNLILFLMYVLILLLNNQNSSLVRANKNFLS